MPSGFTTARTMRKKTPVFRTTSSMAFSQLLGLQERVEEIGESGDGQDETEDGFKGHDVSLSIQISSQRFTYQSDSARRPRVRRTKRASSMEVLLGNAERVCLVRRCTGRSGGRSAAASS